MSEKVIVRQNANFEFGIWAVDPNQPDSDEFEPVVHIFELTPYGMMLAANAACTTQVVFSYAQHHGVNLEMMEILVEYERHFKEDCENCEGIDRYEEHLEENMSFIGDLTADEREKLFHIAHQCPIHKMYENGIEIRSAMVEKIEAAQTSTADKPYESMEQ
ncbi:MAG: OsmC family protein [Anaerolineales bacterium]